jgi:hypothetical protein
MAVSQLFTPNNFDIFAHSITADLGPVSCLQFIDDRVAIGDCKTNQGAGSVAIGTQSGDFNQLDLAVSIGYGSGNASQGFGAVAIGGFAGNATQSNGAIAIGTESGVDAQGDSAIAIGFGSAENTQGTNSIAIGKFAGSEHQGSNSIAIGAFAGENTQYTNSIILNATGTTLDGIGSGVLQIAPIRVDTFADVALMYNSRTTEVTALSLISLASMVADIINKDKKEEYVYVPKATLMNHK